LTAPPYSLIREFSAPDSTRAPAASGVCMHNTPKISAETRVPAQQKAMCHVSPACAACGVLRSAPGASSPQIVGFLASRGRRAHATAPTAGRRGAPSRTSMGSTVRTRCIRRAWRLGSSGTPRPKRDFTFCRRGRLIGARCGDATMTSGSRYVQSFGYGTTARAVVWVWNDCTYRFPSW
jgi:hypothetical protein